MNINIPTINLYYELASQSYCTINKENDIVKKGSLTTILNVIDDDIDIYSIKDHLDLKNNLLSLSNVVVDFDLSDKRFRHLRPKVNFSYMNDPLHCQWSFKKYLVKELSSLLLRVKNETERFNLQKELKIHMDPWDYYIVHDSSYFLKFLLNSRSFDEYEQILLVHFIIRTIELDTISYFEEEPDIIIDKYFTFAEGLLEFNENSIFKWLKFQKENDLVENKTEYIMDNLNM